MSEEKKVLDISTNPPPVDVTDGEILKHTVGDDGDIAAAYANRLEGEDAYTDKERKRLRWKVDVRLIAILWFNTTLSAVDKVTTGMFTDICP